MWTDRKSITLLDLLPRPSPIGAHCGCRRGPYSTYQLPLITPGMPFFHPPPSFSEVAIQEKPSVLDGWRPNTLDNADVAGTRRASAADALKAPLPLAPLPLQNTPIPTPTVSICLPNSGPLSGGCSPQEVISQPYAPFQGAPTTTIPRWMEVIR